MFDSSNIYETLEYSKLFNKNLHNLLTTIVIDIFSSLQIKKDNIKNMLLNSKLVIARYADKTGIYTHIDNIVRSNGLVLTLSFGPNYTYYDLIPLDNKEDSLRIKFNNGEPVIMDGRSRFLYAHAIPENMSYEPTFVRYSLIFLISNYKGLNCVYDKYYDLHICEQNDYTKYK